ncbi:gamma-glutamylcyclotransferase [Kribbella turkmenica]|uniref:Gamma-glutamylcyclotransferase n=1 Tax=Kribbella turkmenica TaxID=2530375 RepID=A0A4R4WIF2_9ACTN|nr:gamma-glutamylcyclotransferase [Kribbella turkmenica]TDD18839.1 gamma-glutamylcyclotransferase [Kribbella turkmenica]
MTLYAAFASNLDPNLMAERCPYSPLRGTGWITGWRLTFGGEELGWEGAMATVVEDPSNPANQVFVALYDVHPKDVERLDEWEWIDQDVYSKIQVRVQTLDGEQLAWMYVLNAYEGGLPSARYLGILAEAAEAAGAPDDYVADLRARPCQSSGH